MIQSRYSKWAEWLVRSLSSNVGYGHEAVETRPGNWLYVVSVHGDCEEGDELTLPSDLPLGHPCVLVRLDSGLPIGVAVRPVRPDDERVSYTKRLERYAAPSVTA